MAKATKINVKPHISTEPGFVIEGWYDCSRTYLWFGVGTRCFATLGDQELYKLAKRIVKEFER